MSYSSDDWWSLDSMIESPSVFVSVLIVNCNYTVFLRLKINLLLIACLRFFEYKLVIYAYDFLNIN